MRTLLRVAPDILEVRTDRTLQNLRKMLQETFPTAATLCIQPARLLYYRDVDDSAREKIFAGACCYLRWLGVRATRSLSGTSPHGEILDRDNLRTEWIVANQRTCTRTRTLIVYADNEYSVK